MDGSWETPEMTRSRYWGSTFEEAVPASLGKYVKTAIIFIKMNEYQSSLLAYILAIHINEDVAI